MSVPTAAEIDAFVRRSTHYRNVMWTTADVDPTVQSAQIVAMSLGLSGDQNFELGAEVHKNTTQYFAVIEGAGTAFLDDREFEVTRDVGKWEVPAGSRHNLKIKPGGFIKLLTIYHPAHHPPGTVDATRAAAETREMQEKRCVICDAVSRIKFVFPPHDYWVCTESHRKLLLLYVTSPEHRHKYSQIPHDTLMLEFFRLAPESVQEVEDFVCSAGDRDGMKLLVRYFTATSLMACRAVVHERLVAVAFYEYTPPLVVHRVVCRDSDVAADFKRALHSM
jgi:mannose-6-phosphate isomerase-like protein (cupin superfamily)